MVLQHWFYFSILLLLQLHNCETKSSYCCTATFMCSNSIIYLVLASPTHVGCFSWIDFLPGLGFLLVCFTRVSFYTIFFNTSNNYTIISPCEKKVSLSSKICSSLTLTDINGSFNSISWCSRMSTVAVWSWLLLYAVDSCTVVLIGVSWFIRMSTVAVWCWLLLYAVDSRSVLVVGVSWCHRRS